MKEEKTIRQLLEMLDNPEAYTEQEIRDIINHDEETREAYRLMVEAKRSSRHTHTNNLTNVDAAWKRFNQKRKAKKQRFSWMKIAASFIIVLLITGVSFAAYRAVPQKQTTPQEQTKPRQKDNRTIINISTDGSLFVINWPRGTWVVTDNDSYLEGHIDPMLGFFWTEGDDVIVKLNGTKTDIHQLANKPAYLIKKVIQHTENGQQTINLITTLVKIPANVEYNVNPELTILLTGTPPKECGTKTTIWFMRGTHKGFSWKDYTYTSWKWDVNDIGKYLKEVSIRKDHRVRVNICKGTPQKHIDRIKKLMQENGVTNYELIKQ